VKATPDLLTATPRSLFAALVKAAQDGLLPDGREGIITVYRQKVQGSTPERHEMVAQWNPMFYGIRKRARELDGIIIDAQVVIAGDEFDYELGDDAAHHPSSRRPAPR
jgi:recombination protein RecT